MRQVFHVGDKLKYTGEALTSTGDKRFAEWEVLVVFGGDSCFVEFHDGHCEWIPSRLLSPITRKVDNIAPESPTAEYTGGSVSYYSVDITNPTSGGDPYTAEANDIIEALGMNYAEGNAFKAIWRRCAARTLGKAKASYKDGLYDAEKVVFFGERMVVQEKRKAGK